MDLTADDLKELQEKYKPVGNAGAAIAAPATPATPAASGGLTAAETDELTQKYGGPTTTPPPPHVATSLTEDALAGWQEGVLSLKARGAMPDVLPSHKNNLSDFAYYGGRMVNDLPVTLAAGITGGMAMSEVPFVGTAAGAMAFGYAAPQAARAALMTSYQLGHAASWGDLKGIMLNELKAFTGGLITGYSGEAGGVAAKAANPLLEKAISSEFLQFGTKGAVETLGQSAGLTIGQAAWEDQMPTAQDFVMNTAMIFGLKAASGGAEMLRNIYQQTGVSPDQVARDAESDPAFKKDLIETAAKNAANVDLDSPQSDIPEKYIELAKADQAKNMVVPVTEKAQMFLDQPFAEITQDLGEPASPGKLNTNYVNSSEDVKMAAARFSELYQQEMSDATRTQPQTEVIAAARKGLNNVLGSMPELPAGTTPTMKGATGNLAADLWGQKQLALQMTGALNKMIMEQDELMQKPGGSANVSAVQQLALIAAAQRTGLVWAEFYGMRADVARAENMLKNIKNLGTDPEFIANALDHMGGAASYEKVLSALKLGLNDPSKLGQAAKAALNMTTEEKIMRGIVQVRNAGLLAAGSVVQVKAVGDALMTGMEMATRWTAALIPGTGVTINQAATYTMQMIRGTRAALAIGRDAFFNPDMRSPMMAGRNVIPSGTVMGEIFGGGIHRVIAAETEFFRAWNEHAELYRLAAEKAEKLGLTPGSKDYNEAVNLETTAPSKETQELVTRAGGRATATEALGWFGQIMQKVSANPVGNLLVLPFAKVPANLPKFAMRYTPVIANLMDSDVWEDFRAGGSRAGLAATRQIIGGGVMYAVYQALMNGTITGGGLYKTPEERQTDILAGKPPYSFIYNGTAYDYTRLQPLSHIIMLTADLAEAFRHAGNLPEQAVNLPGLIVSVFGHAMISSTYMAQLDELMKALTEPGSAADRFSRSFVGSFIPTISAQTGAQLDPFRRRVDSMMDEIKSRFPIFREMLLPKLNPLTGEPLENPAYKNITPFKNVHISEDKVIIEAERLQVGTPFAPKNISVLSRAGLEGKVQLTPEQQNAYIKAQGTMAYQILNEIVHSSDYAAAPPMVQGRIFKMALTAGSHVGRIAALPPDSPERMEAVDTAAQSLIKQLAPKPGM